VIGALALCAEEPGAGALVTIDASRARIRHLLLPFRQPFRALATLLSWHVAT
jgi:hypothetical protein